MAKLLNKSMTTEEAEAKIEKHLRKKMPTIVKRIEQKAVKKYRDSYRKRIKCKIHPDVKSDCMWGCPDCLYELRTGRKLCKQSKN